MSSQDIIEKILAANPSVSEQQIREKLEAEKTRTGGLLGEATILRLIAAKYGVEVQQNGIQNSGILSTSRLHAGLNDVTVAGRLIAVFPVRSFEGEKPGKFSTLILMDSDGILRVVLWNEKAEMVERRELKVGQAVRLLHGYTRADRAGKIELHLGVKSQIQFESPEKATDYPNIEKFAAKIGSLNLATGNVHLSGKIKDFRGSNNFKRNDSSEGTVMRLILADDSGQVLVVAWNEKAKELEKAKIDTYVQLINARIKEAQNGGIEVHVDSNTCINFQYETLTNAEL